MKTDKTDPLTSPETLARNLQIRSKRRQYRGRSLRLRTRHWSRSETTTMTTTMTNNKKITITMSETAPVSVDPEQWPVVAEVETCDSAIACQANTEWSIKVREHVDGRRLVYGWECRGPGGQHAGYRGRDAGYLIDAASVQGDGPRAGKRFPDDAETIRAIRRVAGVINDELLGAECIRELPAQEI